MQRSRKALLERRAVEKKATNGRNYLYKISLSLVFVLWGLVFLFSLWISCGYGYGDGCREVPVGVSNWHEDEHKQCKNSNSADEYSTKETDDTYTPSGTFSSDVAKSNGFIVNSLSSGESINNVVPRDKENYIPPKIEEHEVERSESSVKLQNDAHKNNHLSQAMPLGLDEFKSRAIGSKIKSGTSPHENVIHRLEPGGVEYNYASAAKGAKVLSSNKEARGASDILSRNKDKYLRNPCSSEEKFVVIELSEETLVKTIEIANFEHHSSNFKDFELHGSLVYPTDSWIFLGNFTASNVKQAQRFVLQEQKWVRYLKLNLQSHYGSEFYCTLSIVEVYGVDAIERMLEDLIYAQDKPFVSGENNGEKRIATSILANAEDSGDVQQNTFRGINPDSSSEISSENKESVIVNSNIPDPVEEIRQQVGRMPGDTVLKILMQKVRYLDLNLSVLEQYMEDLNSRYVSIFKEYGKDMGEKDLLLQKIKEEIRRFLEQQDVMMKELSDLDSWKSHISVQLDHVLRDNAVLRSEVEKVRENQVSMENKSVVVFSVCVIFSFLAILRLSLDMIMSIYRVFFSFERTITTSRKFCQEFSSWFLLLLSCSIIIFTLTL
ncbi:SUN domain-containing protein 4 [Vigna umbellata]|uniref:SUN domain-containing protein 4 n=1 Tax=Vigna umbellata TaxID=87088 RepID=UPI001F5E3D86|nr:SUN domain-containing protein 4 [Vigna umbellata]XP_047161736.1 SUN domain-containing protein 4 [Vigna umbellata]